MFENFRVFETDFAGRPLRVETGKMAGLANGACLVRYGDTVVHVAALPASPERVWISSLSRWILKKNSIPWVRSPVPF